MPEVYSLWSDAGVGTKVRQENPDCSLMSADLGGSAGLAVRWVPNETAPAMGTDRRPAPASTLVGGCSSGCCNRGNSAECGSDRDLSWPRSSIDVPSRTTR